MNIFAIAFVILSAAGPTEEIRDGNVCDPDSENALPCVYNPYWCNEGWDPLCLCDAIQEDCRNICEFIECDEDEVCIPSDGSCQLLGDDCWTQGCEQGTICIGGECVDDPCFEVECVLPEYCNNEGECVDVCFCTDCTEDQGCYEGECVDDPCVGTWCPDDTTCNPENGQCEEFGPCYGVVCEFYEVCVQGECVEDPCWNLECTNGYQCIFGACYEYEEYSSDVDVDIDSDVDTDTDIDSDGDTDTEDTDTDSQADDEGMDNVLATGIGGCLCATAPGARKPLHIGLLTLLAQVAQPFSFSNR